MGYILSEGEWFPESMSGMQREIECKENGKYMGKFKWALVV